MKKNHLLNNIDEKTSRDNLGPYFVTKKAKTRKTKETYEDLNKYISVLFSGLIKLSATNIPLDPNERTAIKSTFSVIRSDNRNRQKVLVKGSDTNILELFSLIDKKSHVPEFIIQRMIDIGVDFQTTDLDKEGERRIELPILNDEESGDLL